ncbi:Phosphoserine phosphatase [Corynebacterium faecale]|uniref:HAD family hydrolase n=1 Tax=Corynebacterium faecale TaxID=1758466 RepID=UPI003F494518|nr:Phosphoserine phosphatase [Corynebacterium faecale]
MNNPDFSPLARPGTGDADRATPGTVAAFFDLDKTIIAMSSTYAYGREFMNSGLISPVEALQLSLAQATYMFAGHTSEQMDNTRDQLTAMVRGWDVQQVRSIAEETMHTVVTPTIYAEARELIDYHRERGHDVIIISASVRELVEPIAKELGVTRTVNTILEAVDGRYTGEVLFYCKGAAKQQAIFDLAEEHGYDLESSFAYSDAFTDVPMLETVGNPVAVNPDRALKKTALERGWTILSFKNPEPLFQMPSTRDVGIGTGVVAGLAAMAAGGIWWVKRARRGTA